MSNFAPVIPDGAMNFIPQSERKKEPSLPEEKVPDVPEAIIHKIILNPPSEKADRFEDLKQNIVRDGKHVVITTKEMADKVNTFEYEASQAGFLAGQITCCLTLGCYYLKKRHIVPDGYFGHYTSDGRDMIKPPGIHVLLSFNDDWAPTTRDDPLGWKKPIVVDTDDISQLKRSLGAKYLVTVPENYLGGAYVILGDDHVEEDNVDGVKDGDFVLLNQGRHVLDDSDYKGIEVVNLQEAQQPNQHKVRLGPIQIVYVKEGYIAGAWEKQTGVYRLFQPGPPVMLHDKNYEDLAIVRRSKQFTLGPYSFITVHEGEIAGAYHMETGNFQILPPGNTYKLHSKDYDTKEEGIKVVKRTEQFVLGPYFYVTVKKGKVAGAYKIKGGDFVVLPEGKTYQLVCQEYEEPILVRKNSHMVVCGPLTFLTVKRGTLAGGFKVSDGQFVVFEDESREYLLHEKEYHDIVVIKKYTPTAMPFGPNQVVTIPEGMKGVFECEGQIEIKDPGYYMVSSEYTIKESIPVNSFTITAKESFKTKDGCAMEAIIALVWTVIDPKNTALVPEIHPDNGGFPELGKIIDNRFRNNMTKFSKRYNRSELLPTKQDVLNKDNSSDVSRERVDELLEQDIEDTTKLYSKLETDTKKALQDASEASSWGVVIDSVKVEGFELTDKKISNELDTITQSILSRTRAKFEGDLAIAKAEMEKLLDQKRTEGRTNVEKEKARGDAEVEKTKADSRAEVRKTRSVAEADAAVIKAKSDNEVKVIKSKSDAQADAEARRITLEIENKERTEKAKANAQQITLIAEAEYEKKCKENDAVAKMSEKQYNLMLASAGVDAMGKMGDAHWRMPDKILQFYESFSPFLRMGPVTAGDMLSQLEKKGR